MIPKGTNVVVNFYATNADGVPLSDASGITPYYRLNGGSSYTLGCNIYSLGSDAPGWFRFSTSHFNTSTGNLFITFKNNSGYIIMPWEDDIVPVGGSTASEIWNYSTRDLTTEIPTTESITDAVWEYSVDDYTSAGLALWYASSCASSVSQSWYTSFSNFDLSTTLDSIPSWVWKYSGRTLTTNVLYHQYANSSASWGALPLSTSIPTSSAVANGVWDYIIQSYIDPTTHEEVTISAGSYLKEINFNTRPITSSFDGLRLYGDAHWSTATGFATPTNVTDATTTITGSIAAITIPTPPTTGEIADSVWGYTLSSKIVGNAIPSVTDIWGDSSVRSLTYYPAFPTPADITSSVWGNSDGSRSLTYYPAFPTIPSPPTTGEIAASVWGYGDSSSRIIGNPIPSVTDIWGDSSARSLTYYPDFPTIPTPPTTGEIATSVWNYTSSSRLVDNTFMSSADVWSYQINGFSAGTYLGSIGTWPTADDIASSVWGYGTGSERIVNNVIPSVEDIWSNSSGWRTLTSYPVFPTTTSIATSVWNYTINGKSASSYISSIGNLPTASSVWTYASRSLTSYPEYPSIEDIQSGLATQQDIADLQSHGDGNWSTATGFASSSDIPGPNTIASSVWNYTDGSKLVDNTIPVPADTSAIAASVWNYTDGSRLVDNAIPTVSSIWSHPSRSLTTNAFGTAASSKLTVIGDITSLQSHGDSNWSTASGFATPTNITTIWNSTSNSISNLQTHGDQTWVGGGGITASDVWGYSSRSLTTNVFGTATSSKLAVIGNFDGLATASNVEAVITHGNTSWITASGFAVAGDAMTLTAAYDAAKVIPPSVEAIQSGLATTSDLATLQSDISKLTGGLFNWSINYGLLTVSVGESVYLYSVTRDMSGNITAIVPSV